eukprot:Gb_33389 [translate_table: standard]
MTNKEAICLLVLSAAVGLVLCGIEASSLNPGAFGDPHFTGWDGSHFDFTGQPGTIYCMLSDPNIHINMKLDGEAQESPETNEIQTRTWITSLGFLFGTHRLILTASKGADLSHKSSFVEHIEADGEKIAIVQNGLYRSPDGNVIITYDEKTSESDKYTVTLNGLGAMTVVAKPEIPDFRTEDNAFFHLSFELLDFSLSHTVHGVLGQTFMNAKGRLHDGSYRTIWNTLLLVQQVEGPNGDGYLDGSVNDYVSSGLLHSDCRYSRFDANTAESINPLIVKVSSGYSRKVLLPGNRI